MSPILIGGVIEITKSLISRIFPDPESRAEAELELIKMQQSGEIEHLETRLSAILAEAKSADPWTSRARPSFLYVIYIYILCAIPMGVVFALDPVIATNVTHGVSQWLSSIPEPIVTLFGAGYLGYSGMRSFDKRTLANGRAGK